MIIKLSDTNTREIAKQLVSVRDSGGQVTTGRVLTLIVVASEDDDLESIIKATHDASREHPSRVLIMVAGDPQGEPRVDADIRFGGDAGASEIILMALHHSSVASRHPHRGVVAIESTRQPSTRPNRPHRATSHHRRTP